MAPYGSALALHALAAAHAILAVGDRGVLARAAVERVLARTTDQLVLAGAAVQLVVALAAVERVVARATVQRVVAGAALEPVVLRGAVQHVRRRAALRVAGGGGAGHLRRPEAAHRKTGDRLAVGAIALDRHGTPGAAVHGGEDPVAVGRPGAGDQPLAGVEHLLAAAVGVHHRRTGLIALALRDHDLGSVRRQPRRGVVETAVDRGRGRSGNLVLPAAIRVHLPD